MHHYRSPWYADRCVQAFDWHCTCSLGCLLGMVLVDLLSDILQDLGIVGNRPLTKTAIQVQVWETQQCGGLRPTIKAYKEQISLNI